MKRGIAADLSYYFDPAKLVAYDAGLASWSESVKDYPNPDLAIEIDISHPKIDRPAIYAALRVWEVLRVRDRKVWIEQLGPDGTYTPAPCSRFLPVSGDDIVRWVLSEDVRGSVTWKQRLREWVQAELALLAKPAN